MIPSYDLQVHRISEFIIVYLLYTLESIQHIIAQTPMRKRNSFLKAEHPKQIGLNLFGPSEQICCRLHCKHFITKKGTYVKYDEVELKHHEESADTKAKYLSNL